MILEKKIALYFKNSNFSDLNSTFAEILLLRKRNFRFLNFTFTMTEMVLKEYDEYV